MEDIRIKKWKEKREEWAKTRQNARPNLDWVDLVAAMEEEAAKYGEIVFSSKLIAQMIMNSESFESFVEKEFGDAGVVAFSYFLSSSSIELVPSEIYMKHKIDINEILSMKKSSADRASASYILPGNIIKDAKGYFEALDREMRERIAAGKPEIGDRDEQGRMWAVTPDGIRWVEFI